MIILVYEQFNKIYLFSCPELNIFHIFTPSTQGQTIQLNIRILHNLVIIFAIIISGCSKGLGPLSKKEGEIIYDITYIENNLDKISADMLPKKMVTQYQNNKYTFVIEGFFGLFNITNVIIPKESINRSKLTVLSKKFYYDGELNETAVGFGMMPKMKFDHTGNTKTICGYLCQEVLVTFPEDIRTDTLKVYYTKDIPLDKPNRSTPYSDINGVLLEFYLQLHKVEMKLTANSIYEKAISDQTFEKGDGYQRATKEYMEAVLFKLLDTE